MDILRAMLEEPELSYLRDFEFQKMGEGRYFERNREIHNRESEFFVVLGPNSESPIHNHKGGNFSETHILRYGSGKFFIYDSKGIVMEEMVLRYDEKHPIFSTPEYSPNHKFVAGPWGCVLHAFEVYL